MERRDLINRFAYHKPSSPAVADLHQRIRTLHLDLALEINDSIPDGREKSVVMTKLEESMMWSNAGIARCQPIDPAQSPPAASTPTPS